MFSLLRSNNTWLWTPTITSATRDVIFFLNDEVQLTVSQHFLLQFHFNLFYIDFFWEYKRLQIISDIYRKARQRWIIERLKHWSRYLSIPCIPHPAVDLEDMMKYASMTQQVYSSSHLHKKYFTIYLNWNKQSYDDPISH